MVLSMAACGGKSSKDDDSETRERTRSEERTDKEDSKESKEKNEESKDDNKNEISHSESEELSSKKNINQTDKSFSRVYVALVPVKDFMADSDKTQMEEMGMNNLLEVSMQFMLEFNNQNDFIISVDMDALKKDMSERLLIDVDNLIKKTFSEQGVTPDQYDTLVKYAGYASYEDMKSAMVKEFETEFENSVGSQMDTFHMGGEYKVSENEIIFESGEKAQIQPDGSLTMSLASTGVSLDLVFEKQ